MSAPRGSRILLRATNWVGDVVMSLPALKALDASFPDSHLAVLARPWVADLYRIRPEVDELVVEDASGPHAGAAGRARLAAELRGARFDRAILLPTSFGTAWTVFRAGIPERIGYRGEGRSPLLTRAVPLRLDAGEHQVWKYLRLVEAAGAQAPAAPDVSWNVPKELLAAGRGLLRENGWDGSPFVAVHAASFAHAAKRWSLAGYAEVLDRLRRERSFAVVLLGSASESRMNAELAARLAAGPPIDLSGKSRLTDALGLLAQAALFVGNDSGLSHLAGAIGTPTLVVFGATDPDATRPWDGPRADGQPARVRIVRRPVLCSPCRFSRCPIDHRCMTGIEPEDILSAAAQLLASRPSPTGHG